MNEVVEGYFNESTESQINPTKHCVCGSGLFYITKMKSTVGGATKTYKCVKLANHGEHEHDMLISEHKGKCEMCKKRRKRGKQ